MEYIQQGGPVRPKDVLVGCPETAVIGLVLEEVTLGRFETKLADIVVVFSMLPGNWMSGDRIFTCYGGQKGVTGPALW